MDGGVEGTGAATRQGPAAEREYVLVPRRVGPGRVERGYQRRIETLAQSAVAEQDRRRSAEQELERRRGELEVAARLERGLQRLADRLEQRVETAAQREKRLILALGGLQKENELLRERLALTAGPAPAQLSGPAARSTRSGARSRQARSKGGWLGRLVGRRRPS